MLNRRIRLWRILGCAMLAGLFAGAGPGVAQDAMGRTSLVGLRAPDIARADLRGAPVSLAALRGKVVLLNFWATWCAPCRVEMPRFVAWQKQYGVDGLQIVSVSIDDSEPPARALVERMHLDYPVVMGDAKLGERYGGVLGVPVTFLIDRRGVIRARIDGETDLGALQGKIEAMLAAH